MAWHIKILWLQNLKCERKPFLLVWVVFRLFFSYSSFSRLCHTLPLFLFLDSPCFLFFVFSLTQSIFFFFLSLYLMFFFLCPTLPLFLLFFFLVCFSGTSQLSFMLFFYSSFCWPKKLFKRVSIVTQHSQNLGMLLFLLLFFRFFWRFSSCFFFPITFFSTFIFCFVTCFSQHFSLFNYILYLYITKIIITIVHHHR